jgi:hypothetical protein
MGNPSPVKRGRGRPRGARIDWNDPEQVAAYHRERAKIRKQARQQHKADESSDIVWGGPAGARLWNCKENQFYHRARMGALPGVVKIAGSWASSRKARDATFAAATDTPA